MHVRRVYIHIGPFDARVSNHCRHGTLQEGSRYSTTLYIIQMYFKKHWVGTLPSTAWMEWRYAMKNWTQTSVVECQEGTPKAFLCFLTTLSKVVQWHLLLCYDPDDFCMPFCWPSSAPSPQIYWKMHLTSLVSKQGCGQRIESNWELLPSKHQCGSTSREHNQFHGGGTGVSG